MKERMLKTSTPPPKILRVAGKLRCIACALALLLCSCLCGCSSKNKKETNDLHLAHAYTYEPSWETRAYYILYFSFIYTDKNYIMNPYYDLKGTAYFDNALNTENYRAELYANQTNLTEYSSIIPFIPPNTRITFIFRIAQRDFEDKKNLTVALYYGDTEEGNVKTIVRKTFAAKSLLKEINRFIDEDA